MILVMNPRRGRFEVGYGLEAELTDAKSSRILHDILVPQMQAGEAVQYFVKKNTQIYVLDAKNKKREYQIVGQTAVASPAPPAQ